MKERIVYPAPGSVVKAVETLVIHPGMLGHSGVQIMVRARDGLWYLQAPAERGFGRYRIKTFFGKLAPAGTDYNVALIRGGNTVKVPTLMNLDGLPVIELASFELEDCPVDQAP